MITIEVIAVIFSLLCVILTIKENVWNWPIGLVGVTAYALLFFDVKLYADFGLQFIFFAQGIYGWWYWKKGNSGLEPSITHFKFQIYHIVCILSVYFSLVFVLKTYTDSSFPQIDSFVSLGSLLANWMLAKKKIESWIVWIIVDAAYVVLFIYKGLYLSSGLYFVFFMLAINGLINWNKRIKNYEKI